MSREDYEQMKCSELVRRSKRGKRLVNDLLKFEIVRDYYSKREVFGQRLTNWLIDLAYIYLTLLARKKPAKLIIVVINIIAAKTIII